MSRDDFVSGSEFVEDVDGFNDEEINEDVIIDTGVVLDPEVIDKANELKKEGRLVKTSTFFNWLFRLAAILCVLSGLYVNSLYAPTSRTMNNDNLFESNAVVVDGESIAGIILKLEEEFGIDLEDDNDNSLLLNAVYCNENLSDEEKAFCCKYIDLFKDNPYLDKGRVYHALLNVDISYKNRPYIYEDTVEGVYIDDYKSIGIFVEDSDKNVLAHELIHCICANSGNLPTFFVEGMTELLANEYFSDNPFLEFKNYPYEVYVVKMLCDTAGTDAVLKAYTTGDMTPVYESLAESYGSVEDAKKAIDIFNDFFLFVNGDKDTFDYSGEELTNDALLYLHNVNDARYGDGEELKYERASFYYNEIMFLNLLEEDSSSCLVKDLEEYGVLFKVYFSSSLKEKYPDITIGLLEDMTVINEADVEMIKQKKN